MGELAALLDDMAEALVHYPEEILVVDDVTGEEGPAQPGLVVVRASTWPTIQEIDRLLANWRVLHNAKAFPAGKPRAA